jgi:WD40 repeat protein
MAIVDAQTGTETRVCGNWCRAFGLTPDGNTALVADGGYLDLIHRYDLEDGHVRSQVELETGAINRIAVSPDGTMVAAVGTKQFQLLHTETLTVIASNAHRAFSNGAFALAFNPRGQTLVFSAGRTLFVWEVPSARPEGFVAAAREVNRVSLDTKHFMDATFTPDGHRLITVSKEGIARVWETANWECERSFAWNVGPLRAVAVSPDGTRAAVAGDTGRVVVWDLDE